MCSRPQYYAKNVNFQTRKMFFNHIFDTFAKI